MDDVVKKKGAPDLPACVIVANSNNLLEEWHFETLDLVIETAVGGGAQIPVVILGAADARETPRSLLLPPASKYLEQDHVLPRVDLVTSKDAPCGILMSGLSRAAMQSIIYGLKEWNSPAHGKFPKMAFAMVVENALDTSFSVLFEQIMNDWRENEG